MPEAFFDPATGVKAKEFGEHLAALTALKAEHDARLAARPEKPDGYKVELPKDFKPPEGMSLLPDEKDVRLPLLRNLAHELGLSQDQFAKFVAIDAQRAIEESNLFKQAHEAEQKKLGANATARITGVKTWLTGMIGADRAGKLMERFVLADDIAAVEDIVRAFSTQGGAGYQGNGRDTAPPQVKPPIEQRWYGERKAS